MSRDTQFAVFASLLWQETRDRQRQQIEGMRDGLVHTSTEWNEEMTRLITQRAYDLVCHAVHELDRLRAFSYGYRDEVGSTPQQMIKGVPDMTELPEVHNGYS